MKDESLKYLPPNYALTAKLKDPKFNQNHNCYQCHSCKDQFLVPCDLNTEKAQPAYLFDDCKRCVECSQKWGRAQLQAKGYKVPPGKVLRFRRASSGKVTILFAEN